MIATSNATASEISAAQCALSQKPPKEEKGTMSGIAAKIADRASECPDRVIHLLVHSTPLLVAPD